MKEKKNVIHRIKDSGYELLLSLFKLSKYDIWEEQDPRSKCANHP